MESRGSDRSSVLTLKELKTRVGEVACPWCNKCIGGFVFWDARGRGKNKVKWEVCNCIYRGVGKEVIELARGLEEVNRELDEKYKHRRYWGQILNDLIAKKPFGDSPLTPLIGRGNYFHKKYEMLERIGRDWFDRVILGVEIKKGASPRC